MSTPNTWQAGTTLLGFHKKKQDSQLCFNEAVREFNFNQVLLLLFSVDPLTGEVLGQLDGAGVLSRKQDSQLSAPAPVKSNNAIQLLSDGL